MPLEWPVGAACAFVLALVATPAGVSGAVLLLPVQLSVLGVPSPSVTPTNLLFNVAATPGALLRFWQEQRLFGPLSRLLILGTLPGVVAGAVLRVELLSGAQAFTFVAACVLLPLGLWLLVGGQRLARPRPRLSTRASWLTWSLALVVGTVGGIYGIGGGSLLAPILLTAGFSAFELAPATLFATFLTSIVGVLTYEVLELVQGGEIAAQWALGAWIGAGGFAAAISAPGSSDACRTHRSGGCSGSIACVVAVRYVQIAASDAPTRTPSAQRG